MGETPLNGLKGRRFPVNPVEIVILLTITLVFCNSIYNLFYDSRSIRPTALQPMAANPISEGRAPASVASAFMSVEVPCDNALERETTASKIRLTGSLCGLGGDTTSAQLIKATVLNGANRFNATVFTDSTSSKFSTDYIPLSTGKNSIHLEFAYRGGKTASQEVLISKF